MVIMEPVKGGTLVKLPEAVADVLRETEPARPLPRGLCALPGRCRT